MIQSGGKHSTEVHQLKSVVQKALRVEKTKPVCPVGRECGASAAEFTRKAVSLLECL